MFLRRDRIDLADGKVEAIPHDPLEYFPMADALWTIVEQEGTPAPTLQSVESECLLRKPFDALKTTHRHNVTRKYRFSAIVKEKEALNPHCFEMSLEIRFDETASYGDQDLFLTSMEKLSGTLPSYVGNSHRRWLVSAFEDDCINAIVARETKNLCHRNITYPDPTMSRESVLMTSGVLEKRVLAYITTFAKGCGVPSDVFPILCKGVQLTTIQMSNASDIRFTLNKETFYRAMHSAYFEGKLSKRATERLIEKAKDLELSFVFNLLEYVADSVTRSGRVPKDFSSDVAYNFYLFDVMQMMLLEVCNNPTGVKFTDLMVRRGHHTRMHLLAGK